MDVMFVSFEDISELVASLLESSMSNNPSIKANKNYEKKIPLTLKKMPQASPLVVLCSQQSKQHPPLNQYS